ncbi:putative nucleolar complex protein 14 [Echria macrotheca]|uniref:Nucleolar complex protein 14 n=1 Tax=Echria macrotheca TaxID=438768 RepID=A0AAJ0F9G7_9PEZI|nr:putative nucleolar complex protein 14 [Echria macrotheca]
MAGSQLKRLKASLKDQGIIGPQQSKKQKRKNALDAKANSDKRLNRSEALEGIREQFNPFQFKTNARGPKFDVTTSKPANDRAARGINGRPGLAKSIGEEKRRQTLLAEMQRRNKVGGLVDRRFGENDPTMTLEDKMIERFTREQQRNHKKSSLFDLEDDDEPSEGFLTHGGKAILFGDAEGVQDDFAEEDLPSGDESDGSHAEKRRLKRLRLEQTEEEESAEEDGQPERKKTKKEIYEEIIAKSKLHKYERQAAKEEDGELRAELDKALPELQSLLFQRPKPQSKDAEDGNAPVIIAGVEKTVLDKEYDVRVKQLAADKRAQPAERTKTDEEKAKEESKRLKELEEKRMKRMRGEADESEDEEMEDDEPVPAGKGTSNIHAERMAMIDHGDDDEFGLGEGIKLRPTATELGFDDEDDFLIDDDLVASGSDLELDSDEYGSEQEEEDSEQESDSDDDEFTKGLLTGNESKDSAFQIPADRKGDDKDGVPYTFPCPQNHEELLKTFQGIEVTKLPIAVQRIRALYHPKLDSRNKERLGNFSHALIQHVAYLGNSFEPHWFPTLESLLRHIHSLAKTFPIEVAKGYRTCLQEMEKERPLALSVGDLVLLTGIGTTFPTSDHFHQVVTPAMLSIGRYLGQKIPQNLADYATGTYLSILALQYQQLSKRYVPELINFCLNTLCSLAPRKPTEKLGSFPVHQPAPGIRIQGAVRNPLRKLTCADCQPDHVASLNPEEATTLKLAIVSTAASILKSAADTWHKHAAFSETFSPATLVLSHLLTTQNKAHLPVPLTTKLQDSVAALSRLLALSRLARRPLELHHHRPLAIRTYVPKFEDAFDPTKHYDPDRERAELAKLRAEHKRERKGAMRELRKDAAFMARENLRAKKVRDEAYEKKYKRLVAEIQGEEGHAANEYAKEKALRKKKR